MLFILPLCYVFLIEALDTGRWRWWGAYGAALFALMYSNALHIYPAVGLGLCGLAAIAIRRRDPEARIQIGRFSVVTVAAGMAFLQLMLPCVPQFIEYQNTSAVQGQMDRRWLSSYFGLLFAGRTVEQHGASPIEVHGAIPLGGQPPDPVHGVGRLEPHPARSRYSKAIGWRKSPCARRHRTLAPGACRLRHFHGVAAPSIRMVFAFSPARRGRGDRTRLG